MNGSRSDAPLCTDERVTATLSDGSTVRGRPDLVALAIQTSNDLDSEKAEWIAQLRSIGIKAAHPDDGWVKRDKSKYHDFVQFCYPQFNDGVKEGDRIALGWPDRYRVRIVQRVIVNGLIWKHEEYQVIK
jgi:hypothetical protein